MPQSKDTTIEGRIERIRLKLSEAARRGRSPFGSAKHGFRLAPAAGEPDVSLLESSCGVTLPPEYRAFITRVGDGGAGPAYGLLPLRRAMDYDVGSSDPGRLRAPFPWTEFYDALDLHDPVTLDGLPRPGSLTVCDEGCYHRHFIVVTGPARGQMWIDSTTSDGGFIPLRVGFLDWYERWLDDALAGGKGTWWLAELAKATSPRTRDAAP